MALVENFILVAPSYSHYKWVTAHPPRHHIGPRVAADTQASVVSDPPPPLGPPARGGHIGPRPPARGGPTIYGCSSGRANTSCIVGPPLAGGRWRVWPVA